MVVSGRETTATNDSMARLGRRVHRGEADRHRAVVRSRAEGSGRVSVQARGSYQTEPTDGAYRCAPCTLRAERASYSYERSELLTANAPYGHSKFRMIRVQATALVHPYRRGADFGDDA